MPTFQGRRVSAEWKVVLDAAAADGVRFRLNSGQRTLGEQQQLYNLYRSGRGNLAAYPNPNAPHIRAGRIDHALDIDMYAGTGIGGFMRWAARQGIRVTLPIRGEGWHGEASAAE
jgi:hypothetical protein